MKSTSFNFYVSESRPVCPCVKSTSVFVFDQWQNPEYFCDVWFICSKCSCNYKDQREKIEDIGWKGIKKFQKECMQRRRWQIRATEEKKKRKWAVLLLQLKRWPGVCAPALSLLDLYLMRVAHPRSQHRCNHAHTKTHTQGEKKPRFLRASSFCLFWRRL